MFDKETVRAIIEDCMLRIEMFDARHNGKAKSKRLIIRTNATDGGGMSTYGLSYALEQSDHYECHDSYLYIHRETEGYDIHSSSRKRTESVAFIPYGSIVAIECEPMAYI